MLGNIIKKELKELLSTATIISIISMAIFFGIMGQVGNSVKKEAEKTAAGGAKVGLVNKDSGEFGKIAENFITSNAKVIYHGNDVNSGLEKVKSENATALIIIPEDFTENILKNKQGNLKIKWILKGIGLSDGASTGTVNQLLNMLNQEITKTLIKKSGNADAEFVINPVGRSEDTLVKGKEFANVSPYVINNSLMSGSISMPIVIMMLIIMSGSSIISSMAMEKENKTLETLLTLPVKRNHIILGKIIASTITGLIMGAIYMLGFTYYMNSLSPSGVNPVKYGFNLQTLDYVLIALSLFSALMAGLSMCLVLGTMAKNTKSAQFLSFPVSMMGIFPMFITMIKDFSLLPLILKILVFIIPFSHPMMAMRFLLFDEYSMVIWGIFYSIVFSAIMVGIGIKIFNSDKLLVGKIKKIKEVATNAKSLS